MLPGAISDDEGDEDYNVAVTQRKVAPASTPVRKNAILIALKIDRSTSCFSSLVSVRSRINIEFLSLPFQIDDNNFFQKTRSRTTLKSRSKAAIRRIHALFRTGMKRVTSLIRLPPWNRTL